MSKELPTEKEYQNNLQAELKKLSQKMKQPVVTYMKKGNDQLYFVSPKELPLKHSKIAIKKSVDQSWQFLYNTKKQTLKYNNGFAKVMTTMQDSSWGNIVYAAKQLSSYKWIMQNDHAKKVLLDDPEHFYEMEAVLVLLLNFMNKKAEKFKKTHHHKKHIRHARS